MWVIPLLSSIISLFFTLYETERYLKSKAPADLLYALSLFLFTLAAFGEFYSEAFGWQVWIYKLYYFPAITLVAFMASATLYTRSKPLYAHLFLGYVLLLSLALLIVMVPASVDTKILFQSQATVGGAAMPPAVRSFSFWLSGIGGILLLGTSLWNYWRTRRTGFLFLAGGALVMSLGGGLAKRGLPYFLTISELIGILLLFYGVYLLAHQRKHKGGEKPLSHPILGEKRVDASEKKEEDEGRERS